MFNRMTRASVALVQKYLPDAFIFAIILTILTFFGSMFATKQSVLELVNHWSSGVWSLLSFTMQMALVLILGNALASSKPIKKLLISIASLPKNPTQAIMLVTFVSAISCWLNWGFGLIVGALLAREIAKKVHNVDYRLLIASAYSGFVVWHGGISGSVPLTVASDVNEVINVTQGALTSTIPVVQTIFSIPSLMISLILIITLPLLNRMMHPNGEDVISVDPAIFSEDDFDIPLKTPETPAERIEQSRLLSILIVILGASALTIHFITKGFDLNLNIVNLIFLTLGILFHQTPINYVHAIHQATQNASGIVLQFPFYAGIMGLMTGANVDGMSLASMITQFFLNISTANTFPVYTFWSAGLINVFVPSGGGQWAVQGPIMMPASVELGVNPSITTMAIAWGDGWTNMIQPFWALPALSLAKLSARDIMGYCLIVLIYTGIIISLGLYLWTVFNF